MILLILLQESGGWNISYLELEGHWLGKVSQICHFATKKFYDRILVIILPSQLWNQSSNGINELAKVILCIVKPVEIEKLIKLILYLVDVAVVHLELWCSIWKGKEHLKAKPKVLRLPAKNKGVGRYTLPPCTTKMRTTNLKTTNN